MKSLVYLMGSNESYLGKIKEILGSTYHYLQVSRSGLMSNMIKRSPQCIIIIEDDIDRDGFLLVENTVSFEYIPLIVISFSKEVWQMDRYIKTASYTDNKDLKSILPLLVEQAVHFKNLYHGMHVVQDTYEIMNDTMKSTIVDYIDAVDMDDRASLQAFLSNVYTENFFIDNKPNQIWLILKEGNHRFRAFCLPMSTNGQGMEICFEDDRLDFMPYMETGYFKNSNRNEMSDILDMNQLIPNVLLEITGKVDSIASYAMVDMMLIALNYDSVIRQTDLNILKAITLKLDMIMNVKEKVVALEASFEYTLNALARAAEGKDDVTGHHIKRVNHYSKIIAKALGMDQHYVKNIYVAAQMHDVGKIFIPESILNKPGKLTDDEYDLMKRHTIQGEVIIGESQDLVMASRIARYHHERYDGTGYPDGLKGEEIPLEARIVFLADIYDALRSKRSYKPGFTHEEAYKIITEGDGRVEPRHFDPAILRIFKEYHSTFEEIFGQYSDE